MLIVRPIKSDDSEAFVDFAAATGVGHTNLPNHPQRLAQKISHSELSFAANLDQGGEEGYTFVMEDTQTSRLVGTCTVDAAVGLSEPFYSYRVDQVVHASTDLNINNRIPALHMGHDYTGASRLSSFYLEPDYRCNYYDQLLSKSRLLFMACFPERFAATTIAEIKGVIDEQGVSPFWESVGRHFFSMDFAEADLLTASSNKRFIANLMPRYPLYVPLLSDTAQTVIGQHHDDVEDIVNILEHEGLHFEGHVDIFDAGPILEVRTRHIRAIRHAEQIKVQAGDPVEQGKRVLVSNNSCHDFRCIIARKQGAALILSESQLKGLQVANGNTVTYCPL
ncbi:MAG: arginine N-succinyltransferase [Oceanospirillaceae bacterium]|nr:arginine N-succinyltransferase [Oceanospirillaceae bacterium]